MSGIDSKIMNVVERHPLACLATITEEGVPWARYVWAEVDRHLNFYIPTHMDSRKMDQIRANPNVHITCGATSHDDEGPYIQVQGIAKLSTKRHDRKKAWSPVLKNIFDGPNDVNYEVIIVKPQLVEYCDGGNISVWANQD